MMADRGILPPLAKIMMLFALQCVFGIQGTREETICRNDTMAEGNASSVTLKGCDNDVRLALRQTQYYGSIIIIPLTLVSTILVFLGTLRHLKTSSANVYMFTLAVFDILTIIGHKLFYFLSYYRVDLRTSLNCQMLQYWMTVFHLASLWILVAMTLERVYVVYRPLTTSLHCRPIIAFIVSISVTMAMIAVAITLFWEFDMVTIATSPVPICWVVDMELFRAMTWVRNTLQCFAPITILTICNVAIVRGLHKQRKSMKEISLRKSVHEKSYDKQIQSITITLFTISVIYVVLTLPYAIKFVLDAYWDYTTCCDDLVGYHIFNVVVYRLQDVIHCMKGYIYLATSQKFRREVMKWSRRSGAGNSGATSISTVYESQDTKL